jgi:tripartite-type tricarboxylate transporter receptor subunit TctC
MLVPFPAGGSTDIVGRTIADALAALWKTSVIVENVAGAGANLGMDRVAKGPTDGSTLLVVPPNSTTNQFLYTNMPFNPERDLMPLSQVSKLSNLLCIKKDLGGEVKSVKDFIDYLKKNPGKLNYASSGVGTTIHLSAELFKRMTGTEMSHIPYRGSALALQDLVGGKVDVMFDNLPSALPNAKQGNIIGIAVTADKKVPFVDLPTVGETVPGFNVQSWFGIGVRTGVPAEIAQKVEADVQAVCKTPEVQKRLADAGMETVGSNASQFRTWIDDERKRWGTLITDLKIKAE